MTLSDKAYHVVLPRDMVPRDLRAESDLWAETGAWQEMRSFDEDGFESYSRRTGIANFEPIAGKRTYLKIGYEAGQWLHYFARHAGFRCMEAPSHIEWMPGHQGGQAAYSMVFDGFRHVWCGTVSTQDNGIAPDVRAYKLAKMQEHFSELDADLQKQILDITHEP